MERLDEAAVKELNVPLAISTILRRGYSVFEREMSGLYQDIILDKHPRIYFGGGRLEQFLTAAETIGGVYHYYLANRDSKPLSLVDL